MRKAVMISIKPKWVELIASGQKTVEVRKTRPKIDAPFKCYIYKTRDEKITMGGKSFDVNGGGKVVGEFVCDWIGDGIFTASGAGTSSFPIYDGPCLDLDDYMAYVGGDKKFFGWHISNLKMYDKPKELSKFCNGNSYLTIGENGKFTYTGMTRPPQSWGYVEELE